MSDIKYQTAIGMLRLFDILTILFFIFVFFNKNEFKELKTFKFNFFFIFLILHVLLSYKISTINFIREFIQSIIIFSFLYITIKIKDHIDYRLLLNYGYKISIAMTLWVVVWHLYNGYSAGWKHLQDSRLIFTILPVVHFIYFKINSDKKFIFLLFTSILFLIILYSGERRALLIFFILLFLFYYKGISVRNIFLLFFFYVVFSISLNFITNPYVRGYLEKITYFTKTGNYDYTIHTGEILEGDTYSNVVRSFQLQYSKQLFLSNPVLGVGTNGYLDTLENDYGHLKNFIGDGFMNTGIHGEFQRVIVENGIIGFIIYVLSWLQTWSKLKKKINELEKINFFPIINFKFIILALYLSPLIYISLAGSSLRSFIMLGIISVLPIIIDSYINRKQNE